MDGGSYYWEIDIDLDEKTIYGFGVHGIADLKNGIQQSTQTGASFQNV